MTNQSALALLAIIALIFAPVLETWLFNSPAHWYRIHLAWGLVVVVLFLSRRDQFSDDP